MSTEVTEQENNEVEHVIDVLNEDEAGVISYSVSLPVCIFAPKRRQNLVIPYSTIKQFKAAREARVREAYFIPYDRPDSQPNIRALLDLWGFESYIEYLNTLCELSFLEGLIPVLDVGFLSPKELKRIQEITAVNKIMLNTYAPNGKKVAANVYSKQFEIAVKSLEWCGRLKFPVIAGLFVGVGETKAQRQSMLQQISQAQQKYGNIHEVILHNVPVRQKNGDMIISATPEQMFDYYEHARQIIPEEIPINMPVEQNFDQIDQFLKRGITDLGRVFQGTPPHASASMKKSVDDLRETVESAGYTPQQRFPLRKEFIKQETYSKKLGQVFDSFRYKIKKDGQEKLKSAKRTNAS